jgi:sugar (pentulose or hexulose) kinase
MPPGLIGDRFPIQEYSLALAYARTAGLVLDWFRRVFCPSLTLSQLDEMASGVPIGSDGLAVLPHFEGMVSPNPAPEARGLISNLSLNHGLAHIYRAILESLAFSLRENAELLVENGFRFDVIRSIGGGAKSKFWLQMKADVTGMPIEKPAVTEAATLGAAMLAAVGAGEYSSIIECCEAWYATECIFEPNTKRHLNYEESYQRYVRLWQKTYGNKSTFTSIGEIELS